MQVIKVSSVKARVKKVRSLVESAGNKLFAVTFMKRTDGAKRKMVCRRHVKRPVYAMSPNGKQFKKNQAKDSDNWQVTVLDMNKVRYNSKGKMNGRGDWRTIPLEAVTRVKVNGEIYRILA